jgi:hypothetical protein
MALPFLLADPILRAGPFDACFHTLTKKQNHVLQSVTADNQLTSRKYTIWRIEQ